MSQKALHYPDSPHTRTGDETMRDRIWKMLALALLIGPALVTMGCKTGGASDAVLADPVAILDSKTGNSDALKSIGVQLVKTQEQYEALGDAAIFADVDFEANDLIIVSLGEQATGGYSVEISALQLEGETIVVVGKASAPGADAVVTQALTYPYAAAVIANTEATIVVPDIN